MTRNPSLGKRGQGKKDAKGRVILDSDDYGEYGPGRQTKLSQSHNPRTKPLNFMNQSHSSLKGGSPGRGKKKHTTKIEWDEESINGSKSGRNLSDEKLTQT
jgi:hypothetical protein